MSDPKNALTIIQIILGVGNIAVMLYALKSFLSKPRISLEEKITELDRRLTVNEHLTEELSKTTADQNADQEEINKMFKSVMLSFVDFEIAYCMHTNYEFTEDLKKAKAELQDYLTKQ